MTTVAETRPETKKTSRAARTAARRLALQLIYSFEVNRFQDGCTLVPEDDRNAVPSDSLGFADQLFAGFIKERVAIDAQLDKRLENWSLSRLAVIDRALLRLGAYELLYCPETPPKVAINECIELAKEFGTEAKTARLVNGVLDKIAREHRADETSKKDAVVKETTETTAKED